MSLLLVLHFDHDKWSWPGVIPVLEALAARCAILSSVNTDVLALCFEFHPAEDNPAVSLGYLLDNERWCTPGPVGYECPKGLQASSVTS
jgi:hypothetical protein